MSREPALDKRLFSIRMPLKSIFKAQRKFGKNTDLSFREAINRAIDHATKSTSLTKSDYDAIAQEIELNLKSRLNKRTKKQSKEQ